MKKVMLLMLILNSFTSFAIEGIQALQCEKEGLVLSAAYDTRGIEDRRAPVIWAVQLNDSYSKAYRTFKDILLNSNNCEDLMLRSLVKEGIAFICRGELFTPKGSVYGQILLTHGSLEVFFDIAKEQGWSCSLD